MERLQRVLAAAGVASRRRAEELIVEGRVRVEIVVPVGRTHCLDRTGEKVAVECGRDRVRIPHNAAVSKLDDALESLLLAVARRARERGKKCKPEQPDLKLHANASSGEGSARRPNPAPRTELLCREVGRKGTGAEPCRSSRPSLGWCSERVTRRVSPSGQKFRKPWLRNSSHHSQSTAPTPSQRRSDRKAGLIALRAQHA